MSTSEAQDVVVTMGTAYFAVQPEVVRQGQLLQQPKVIQEITQTVVPDPAH